VADGHGVRADIRRHQQSRALRLRAHGTRLGLLPGKQEKAVLTVLRQAELLSEAWAA
jgi:hypothetical protein